MQFLFWVRKSCDRSNLKNFLVVFVRPLFAGSVDEGNPEHEDQMVEEVVAVGFLVQLLKLANGLGCRIHKKCKLFNWNLHNDKLFLKYVYSILNVALLKQRMTFLCRMNKLTASHGHGVWKLSSLAVIWCTIMTQFL